MSGAPIRGEGLARRHRNVALSLAVFVACMVGAAYAAVPLYDLFCRATGFGGRPNVALSAPSLISAS